jgi:hypothetical protein
LSKLQIRPSTGDSEIGDDPVDCAALVTTYVLAFGPETDYLRRLFRSILERWPEILPRTRVILAEPDAEMEWFVASTLGTFLNDGLLESITHERNLGKYVLMRRAFYGDDPPPTPWVQWFDADSFVKSTATIGDLADLLARDADVIGSAHTYRLRGGQGRWATAQPWANGQVVPADQKVSFSVGGWWLARTAALARIDYPWPTLHHRGGDVMLGLAGKLNGFRGHHMGDGICPVAINADWDGTPHKAVRRGESVGGITEDHVGIDHVPGT